jgi:hypothetical protein
MAESNGTQEQKPKDDETMRYTPEEIKELQEKMKKLETEKKEPA